ncbi:WD40 repeat-like protein [Colletotrichum falcatum]|nr:WD40 repeat-like protein [Colletotrichum falcatum]
MLEFQINTVLQFHRSWLGNLGRNVIRYDDWEGMRQKVEASEEILLKESQMLNLTASEKTLEAMRGEAQLSYQNMKSLLSVAQEQLQVAVQHHKIGSEQLAELKRTNRPLDLATVFEARYDSADVQDSPKCESGTRIRIRERIAQWADEGCAEPFFWLVGPAGTGKSTISRTVADTFACQNRLAAGYFFKRGEQGRNDTERLFPTLAMQLAEAIPAFKSCVRESLDGLDREAVQKSSLHAQFGKVLLSPLKRLPHTHASRASIVIIDALDECERPGHLKQVLALLSELAAVITARLRVLVTSRPTSAVVAALNGVRHRNLDLESEHRSDTQTDVATFLKQRFASIKNRREILETWPTQAQLDRLIHLSTTPSPLFIYAATLCRFIDDPDERDDPLDHIYLPILHHVLFGSYNTNERPRPLQENTRAELFDVLGAVVLAVTPLSYNAIAGLLGISAHKVTSPLRHLQAVLSVPRDPKTPVRLLHKSFSDFLLNSKGPRRCEYAVEAAQTHAMLAAKCIRRMKEGLRRDICGIRKPGMLRDKIDKQVIDTHIPADLQYACLHWVHHLQQGQGSLGGEVDRFLYMHLLHWLEVLALLGKVSDGAAAIKQLLNMCKMAPGELGEFIKDANKVITTFGSMIEQTPLQIYGALILFSPVSSKVRQRFWDQRPRDLCIQGIKSDWDAPDQTYEGHHNLVTTVVFSLDNQLVATASWDKTVQLWDAATGAYRQTLKGHNGSVDTVAFSPDSQVVASASSDWTVRLWDAATGAHRQTLEGHDGVINTVAFSPDSRLLASGLGLSPDKTWIMKGEKNVVWLPSEYRPSSSAVRGSVMVIGCSTGRVVRVIAPKM